LKALRAEKGLSQGQLATKIGGDGRQISRYENGHITPSAEALVKLAQMLDCSVDYLLIADAPRRPFQLDDPTLAERLADLHLLTDEDKVSLLHILDALLAKNRIKTFAQQIG
jgi:transcriptional regulator with XRE-family HTH domain